MYKEEIILSECPRCGDQGLEHLGEYSYCVGCNYNDVEGLGPSLQKKIPQFPKKQIELFKKRNKYRVPTKEGKDYLNVA